MTGPLSVVLIVAALLLAAVMGIWCWRDRPVARWSLVAAGVVEALALAQLVLAVARLAGGHDLDGGTAVFIGYLLALLIVVPLGAVIGVFEPTRWGSGALAVTSLVLPILVARLQQLW